jgi:hypothetical protein
MSETIKNPMLSLAAAAHLENLLDIEAGRRPIDADLRSPIIEGRDVLFCAASNLECGQPQCQPGVAEKLRGIAALLVELDVAHAELHVLRSVHRFVDGPRLRQLAEQVRRMAHDDAELVANSLLRMADRGDK